MKQLDIINAFEQLGKVMHSLGEGKEWSDYSLGITEEEYNKLQMIINRQMSYNGWFTKENVRQSLLALGSWLKKDSLVNWSDSYGFTTDSKRVAIIMAGNIPLVGFHDFLSVLISGHKALCKLSSDDKTLLPALAGVLTEFSPEIASRIEFSTGKLNDIEAVIATGSNNSIKYFEQYFGQHPHIFRKNRTSIAVLNGNESKEELEALGKDIFSYFGLGCRNVSHLIVPESYDFKSFFESIVGYGDVIHNNKYGNNYDYNKAVYLMNKHALLDNNFVLLHESEELFSPLAMVYYQRVSNNSSVADIIKRFEEDTQVVVGEGFESFGKAQSPSLTDYADGVDTMKWLAEL